MFMEDAETHGIAEHNFCRYKLLSPIGSILVAWFQNRLQVSCLSEQIILLGMGMVTLT